MKDEYLVRLSIEVLENIVELYHLQDVTGDFPENEWNSVRKSVFQALSIIQENGYTMTGEYKNE